MKTLELRDATGLLKDYATMMGREPVIVTKRGKPMVALVSVSDADWETIRLSTNPKFAALIERSHARHRAEGGTSSDELRRELGFPQRRSPSKRKRSRKRQR